MKQNAINISTESGKKDQFNLAYNIDKWREIIAEPVPTLQLFITNKCNKRCKGCFYEESLGTDEMTLDRYQELINEYKSRIKKVILLGGEPTIHKDIDKMICYNIDRGLKTTLYTNGKDLEKLENLEKSEKIHDRISEYLDVRIGVLGLYHGEKNLAEIHKTKMPVTIVYMLRKDNIDELFDTAKYAEENFNCEKFYISSIRDIVTTQNYWTDTEDTIDLVKYGLIVQKFLDEYNGHIPRIDISRRGTLTTIKDSCHPKIESCRFMNIFPDDKRIICPFDISKKIYTEENDFYTRKCNKNEQCLLQKIVLERI
jgi:MoaA/NifB/PqqE/SkfB family radical SAM enzyme